MSSRVIIVAILFVLAVLTAAQAPRKPTPPPRFTAKSVFVDASGATQMSMQLWYNFPEGKFKSQQFNQFGQEEGLVLVRDDLGKEYQINTTISQCISTPSKPAQDIWSFMATAVFNGTVTLPNGQKCNSWMSYTGTDYVGACFVGDIPLRYYFKFAFFDSDIVVNAVVTNFQPSVQPGAFDVPSFCGRNVAVKHRSESHFERTIRSIVF